MEYQLGNFSEARRLFQEGVWADPGNKDVVYIFQVRTVCSYNVWQQRGIQHRSCNSHLVPAALGNARCRQSPPHCFMTLTSTVCVYAVCHVSNHPPTQHLSTGVGCA